MFKVAEEEAKELKVQYLVGEDLNTLWTAANRENLPFTVLLSLFYCVEPTIYYVFVDFPHLLVLSSHLTY